MSSEKPNQNNVELGDLLVVERNGHIGAKDLISVPIIKKGEKHITATYDNKSFYAYFYCKSFVIKKDKSFLIGKEVPDYLLKCNIDLI